MHTDALLLFNKLMLVVIIGIANTTIRKALGEEPKQSESSFIVNSPMHFPYHQPFSEWRTFH